MEPDHHRGADKAVRTCHVEYAAARALRLSSLLAPLALLAAPLLLDACGAFPAARLCLGCATALTWTTRARLAPAAGRVAVVLQIEAESDRCQQARCAARERRRSGLHGWSRNVNRQRLHKPVPGSSEHPGEATEQLR
jgi:hypothetical protein